MKRYVGEMQPVNSGKNNQNESLGIESLYSSWYIQWKRGDFCSICAQYDRVTLRGIG